MPPNTVLGELLSSATHFSSVLTRGVIEPIFLWERSTWNHMCKLSDVLNPFLEESEIEFINRKVWHWVPGEQMAVYTTSSKIFLFKGALRFYLVYPSGKIVLSLCCLIRKELRLLHYLIGKPVLWLIFIYLVRWAL